MEGNSEKSVEKLMHDAFLFKQNEEFENALKSYQNAIAIDSENIRAWYNMGVVFNRIEEYKAAIACLDEVIRLNPNFEDVRKIRHEIVEAHPIVLIKKLNSDMKTLIDSLKNQGPVSPKSQLRSQISELRGGLVFMLLGLLSLISAAVTFVEFVLLLANGLGFSWILLIAITISILTAIAWFVIPQKFEQIADLLVKVTNMQQKMMDNEST